MSPSKIDIGDLVRVLPPPPQLAPTPQPEKPASLRTRAEVVGATLTRTSIVGVGYDYLEQDYREGQLAVVVERDGRDRGLHFIKGRETESWWDISRLQLVRKFKWPK